MKVHMYDGDEEPNAPDLEEQLKQTKWHDKNNQELWDYMMCTFMFLFMSSMGAAITYFLINRLE